MELLKYVQELKNTELRWNELSNVIKEASSSMARHAEEQSTLLIGHTERGPENIPGNFDRFFHRPEVTTALPDIDFEPIFQFESQSVGLEWFQNKVINALKIPADLLEIKPAIPRSYSRGRRPNL